MAESDLPPDEATLVRQLASVKFRAGVEKGKWRVLARHGTVLDVEVSGLHYESGRTSSFEFRLECDGLPEVCPYVYRWDFAANTRPAPLTQSSPGVVDAFKEWQAPPNNIHGGIYRAWQRYAANHNGWRDKCPEDAWNRDRDITFIMERLYGLVCEHTQWLVRETSANPL